MFTIQIGGGDRVESKQTCGSILKPLPTVAGGNLPTFGVMIPQESGIRAGVMSNVLRWKIILVCVFPHLEGPGHTLAQIEYLQ